MKSKKISGPQGPVSRGGIDAKSKARKGEESYVQGTKTNKPPAIRGLTPQPKSKKK